MADDERDDVAADVRRELRAGPGGQSLVDALLGVTPPKRRLPIVGRMAEPVDKYAITELPQIDCVARLPVCGGRCCSFTFDLSEQDVADGVRFDPANPYRIAHDERGMCVHNRAGKCTIYEIRPAICRTYECSRDARIWVDFEQGVARDRAPSLGKTKGER